MEKDSTLFCQTCIDIQSKQRKKINVSPNGTAIMGCFLMVFLLSFSACSRHKDFTSMLETADSLINLNPDTVIQILETLSNESEKMVPSQKMRRQLLLVSAQNKCNTVFHSDSIQQKLVEYYDRHGTPNERMMAYYLLGRALADMGDSPEAIRSYQKGVECADTTASDCDIRTLCAILGQEAAIFNIQHMPREQLEALRQYCHFAKKDGLTYHYIKGCELQMTAWYALDDTARCFRLTDECHKMYLENRMDQEAESVYPTAILILLQDSQYARAKSLMQAFEGKSGLFDSEGNIQQGREHYYNSKGMYYCGLNRLDSAEFFFRRLAEYDITYNYDAYIGLLQVYRKREMVDSIAKYSKLAERALDSIHIESQADALALAVSSFNYSRKEKIAKEKTLMADKVWKALTLTIIMLITISLFTYLLYIKKKKERKEKQKEIETLHLEMTGFKEKINKLTESENESKLNDNGVVKKFQEVLVNRSDFFLPNNSDWTELKAIFRQFLPLFTNKVIDGGLLGDQEQKVCLLTRIGLHNTDIALLLNTSPQRVSNAKKKANHKLFGDRRASNLYENLKDTQKLSS